VAKKPPATPTGTLVRHIPAGPARDELLGLVRVGIKFQEQQHVGRRPGFLHHYITGLVSGLEAPATFERLIVALELAAARRNGASETPIEQCSRSFELLTYHDPKRGRQQVTFGRLRNIFTEAKRENSRLALSRESGSIECGQAAHSTTSDPKGDTSWAPLWTKL